METRLPLTTPGHVTFVDKMPARSPITWPKLEPLELTRFRVNTSKNMPHQNGTGMQNEAIVKTASGCSLWWTILSANSVPNRPQLHVLECRNGAGRASWKERA
ncbi:uncharacterized protein LOC144157964 [Haemaphysalis longicornis]